MGSTFNNGLSGKLDLPLGSFPDPNSTGNADLDDQLGVDLIYVSNQGGLQLSEKGDYRLVRGYENVRRSVIRRLITAPGEYVLDPTYGVGIGEYVKKKMTGAVLDELKTRIEDQLLQDPRISRVGTLTLTPSVDTNGHPYLRVYLEYEVVGRKVAPISQPFYARG